MRVALAINWHSCVHYCAGCRMLTSLLNLCLMIKALKTEKRCWTSRRRPLQSTNWTLL